MILLALLLATIPLPVNTVVVGSEGIVITAVSSPTAQLFFGAGSTYCSTAVSLAKLPLTVSYSTSNAALCATDPLPGATKQIVAQKQIAAYTITYLPIGSKTPVVMTIPALPPPVTLNCTGKATMPSPGSNGTFSLSCQ